MGVGGERHAPADFRSGRDLVPTAQVVGWAIGSVWTGAENLAFIVIRSLDLPTRDKSLYQLSYTGPHKKSKVKAKFRTGPPVPKSSVLVLTAICHWLLYFHGTTAPVGPVITLRYTHTWWDSSGRMITPSQKPLPDNTQHSKQTSMHPAGFKTAIPASERPQTHTLDRAATGKGLSKWYQMWR
jgi:hypothetical protein